MRTRTSAFVAPRVGARGLTLLLLASLVSQTSCGRPVGVRPHGRGSGQRLGMTRLTLDWTGGLPPAGEYLAIDANGRVSVQLESPRDNGYIGTFALVLPKARLLAVKTALLDADFYALMDKYPPPPRSHDFTAVAISVESSAGAKRVWAASSSPIYPRQLKRLFDPTEAAAPSKGLKGLYAGGVLSHLISEASSRPVAAIRVRIEVPKRSFRVGENISVDVVVKNVGTQLAAIPSLACRHIVNGHIDVRLRDVRVPMELFTTGVDFASLNFGPPLVEYREALDAQAKADLPHVMHMKPGQEWRIAMPKPLRASSPGKYELVGQFFLERLYDQAALSHELAEAFVSGWTEPDSVPLTIAD